jgi:hypothetical protein
MEYESLDSARRSADYERQVRQSDLTPYQCDRCHRWHLAPRSRHTPCTSCPVCTGADGQPKASYVTDEDAKRRAEILHAEQGVNLRVYHCPSGTGWHLTKSHAYSSRA